MRYNYTFYNFIKKGNDYRFKLIYNIPTLTEARAELAKFKINGAKENDKDITLSGAFEPWKIKAQGQDLAP